MKEFKEIIVSKSESVYETIQRLKKDGELEEAWLFVSKEAEKRMSKAEKMHVGESRYVSRKFSFAMRISPELYVTSEREVIYIPECEDPQKIFCIDVE